VEPEAERARPLGRIGPDVQQLLGLSGLGLKRMMTRKGIAGKQAGCLRLPPAEMRGRILEARFAICEKTVSPR